MWNPPGPGIEPVTSALAGRFFIHWTTREVPKCLFYKLLFSLPTLASFPGLRSWSQQEKKVVEHPSPSTLCSETPEAGESEWRALKPVSVSSGCCNKMPETRESKIMVPTDSVLYGDSHKGRETVRHRQRGSGNQDANSPWEPYPHDLIYIWFRPKGPTS